MNVLHVIVYDTLLYDLLSISQQYPCLQEVRGSQDAKKCLSQACFTLLTFMETMDEYNHT